MSDFFSSVSGWFDDRVADVAVAFERCGSSWNRGRAEATAKREASARKTGIVTERDAGLTALPAYVPSLGDAARVVDVSANAIAALDDACFASLVKAHKLNASFNRLRSLPSSLCAMRALRTLRLEGNKLRELPREIGSLAKLTELVVSDNELTRVPASVRTLTRLTRLDLARNNIAFRAGDDDERDDDDDDAVAAGSNGRISEDAEGAEGADGADSGLRHLGACVALVELRLDGNPAVTATPRAFGRLRALKTLGLDRTGVTAVREDVLLGCASLTTLSLRGCVALDAARLRETNGWDAYERRRAEGETKRIVGGVMLGRDGLDDGLDHDLARG